MPDIAGVDGDKGKFTQWRFLDRINPDGTNRQIIGLKFRNHRRSAAVTNTKGTAEICIFGGVIVSSRNGEIFFVILISSKSIATRHYRKRQEVEAKNQG